MLETKSILKNRMMRSPLAMQSALRPKQEKRQRSLFATLTLTSLIDAFAIMVIFLLINFGGAEQQLHMDKDMVLPTAERGGNVGFGTVISIRNGHYFIDDQEVGLNEIPSRLYELHKKVDGKNDRDAGGLIVQADKRMDYGQLSPVILAGAHAGYSQFKFAVVDMSTGGSKQ